jgi:bla regulator protein blaR1
MMNHLWQSTVFALAAALLTLAFRGNRAQVRYWIWLSASVKFLVPFTLLIGLGSQIERAPMARPVASPAVAVTMIEITEPFAPDAPARATRDWVSIAMPGAWACGFCAIVFVRMRGWLRVRAAVRTSERWEIPAPIEVRSTTAMLEPGVVGIAHPVLLVPRDIMSRMTGPQFDAVIAHEMCHVRRRDNLFASIHMIVEAVFWFHPLVWWIGSRLVDERERACDEEVVRTGNEPQTYAAAILDVCKSYAESPLHCVSGVTGSDLKKRIQTILSGRIARDLSLAKKTALTIGVIAAVTLPLTVGIMNAPLVRAQPAPKFEVASIKPCESGDAGGRGKGGGPSSPGTLKINCQTPYRLIEQAYGYLESGKPNVHARFASIEGAPAWLKTERYRIEAKAAAPEGRGMMNGPMMQSLLEDRFKLKVHREPREVPIYIMTAAKGGLKGAKPAKEGTCIPWDYDHLPPLPPPGSDKEPRLLCGMFWRSPDASEIRGTTMENLAQQLSAILDRNVIDNTGITGSFDIRVDLAPEDIEPAPGGKSISNAPFDEAAVIFSALRKLGLRLESTKGAGQALVIDHIERPSEN